MKMDWLLSLEFLRNHPVEGSRALEGLTAEEAVVLLDQADTATAATVLQNVSPGLGSACLGVWSNEKARAVLEILPLESAARMLRLMNVEDQDRVSALLPQGVARALRNVLRYAEGTAATWMDLEWFFFTGDLLMGQVWKILRRRSKPIGSYVYVVDRDGALVGVAGLGEVLRAQPRENLESIMHRPVERISAQDRRATVVNHAAWRRFPTLPVVDDEGVLLGRIRYSTLRNLEERSKPGSAHDSWRHFAMSLAELYWVSSSNLLQGVSGMMSSAPGTGSRRGGQT
jgi:magnesium transporter